MGIWLEELYYCTSVKKNCPTSYKLSETLSLCYRKLSIFDRKDFFYKPTAQIPCFYFNETLNLKKAWAHPYYLFKVGAGVYLVWLVCSAGWPAGGGDVHQQLWAAPPLPGGCHIHRAPNCRWVINDVIFYKNWFSWTVRI